MQTKWIHDRIVDVFRKERKDRIVDVFRKERKMEKSLIKSNYLSADMSLLFNLESSIDSVLAATMYKLCQFVSSERSSIFLFDTLKQQLISFSSLDLEKGEVRISKLSGVTGWVFEHRQPAIANDAYDDSRFYDGVDEMTGFYTRNLICAPLIDHKGCCLGTLQSVNKKSGDFITEDLEFLNLTAGLVAVAIKNNRLFNEIKTTNGSVIYFV